MRGLFDDRLNDSRREIVAPVARTPAGFVPWPENAARRYNACAEPCDMFTGPCCCGAWHEEGR